MIKEPTMTEKPLKGKATALSPAKIDSAVEHGLSARTQKLIDQSESQSTKDNYTQCVALFEKFCQDYGGRGPDGVRRRGLRSLPASPETFAEFVGYLAYRGYAPASVRLALAMVRR